MCPLCSRMLHLRLKLFSFLSRSDDCFCSSGPASPVEAKCRSRYRDPAVPRLSKMPQRGAQWNVKPIAPSYPTSSLLAFYHSSLIAFHPNHFLTFSPSYLPAFPSFPASQPHSFLAFQPSLLLSFQPSYFSSFLSLTSILHAPVMALSFSLSASTP